MKYKLTWEMVKQEELHKYYNADPRYYSNTRKIVPNSEIPDEDWKPKSVEFDDLDERLDQYKTLKEWSETDEEPIRNVKLFKVTSEPQWEEIDGK